MPDWQGGSIARTSHGGVRATPSRSSHCRAPADLGSLISVTMCFWREIVVQGKERRQCSLYRLLRRNDAAMRREIRQKPCYLVGIAG